MSRRPKNMPFKLSIKGEREMNIRRLRTYLESNIRQHPNDNFITIEKAIAERLISLLKKLEKKLQSFGQSNIKNKP